MSNPPPLHLLREASTRQRPRLILRSLKLEDFMEATPQATQRKITMASFDVIQVDRPDVQMFNELLVQYPMNRPDDPQQVVPDNMVVIHPEPILDRKSYNLPLEPAPPFWVMEYVSQRSQRKDNDTSS